MLTLRHEIRFHINSRIWIHRDCLRQSIFFQRQGLHMEIRLPPFEKDAETKDEDSLDFEGYAVAASGTKDHPRGRIAIDQFRIVIREHIDHLTKEAVQDEISAEVREWLSNHQRQRIEISKTVAIEFLDYLRLRGQSWLGTMGSSSYAVLPSISSCRDDDDYRIKQSHGGTIHVEMRDESADLDEEAFKILAKSFETGDGAPLVESLLVDAMVFLRLRTKSDLQRAVLLSAVACELKVKETLREKVFPGGLPLVNALIENPRDFSMSAASLFDKAMEAALGRSLKKDNRELYKKIDNDKGLFFLRNKIAHSGKTVTLDEARQCVKSAQEAIDWLKNLPAATSPPSLSDASSVQ